MLVEQFGLHWPRNQENLDEIEDLAGHKSGIYVLYHGAMPAYIGRGAMSPRLRNHAKEGSKKEQFWDPFSWFVIGKAKSEREREALLLEALPFYVRSLKKAEWKIVQKAAGGGAERGNKRRGAAEVNAWAEQPIAKLAESTVDQQCSEQRSAPWHCARNDVFARRVCAVADCAESIKSGDCEGRSETAVRTASSSAFTNRETELFCQR